MNEIEAHDVALKSWESLAGWIQEQTPEIESAKLVYYRGTLAVGAAILIFSEREEVKAEVEAANKGRRGAKWEAYNFVAAKLSEKYGEALPTAKHLGNCARAAAAAKQKGLTHTSLRELLGWKTFKTQEAFVLSEINPETLQPEKQKNCSPEAIASASGEQLSPDAFANRFVAVFGLLAQKAAELAVKKPRGGVNFSRQHRDAIQKHCKKINVFLSYVNMALHEHQN